MTGWLKSLWLPLLMLLFILLSTLPFIISCSSEPSPEATLRLFVDSIVQKNWETTWDLLSYQSQKMFEEQVLNPIKLKFKTTPQEARSLKHPQLGVSVQDLLDMSAKDFFILNMQKTDMRDTFLKILNPDNLKVEKVKVEGNIAKIKLKGRAQEISLVREQGKWRIVLFEMK